MGNIPNSTLILLTIILILFICKAKKDKYCGGRYPLFNSWLPIRYNPAMYGDSILAPLTIFP